MYNMHMKIERPSLSRRDIEYANTALERYAIELVVPSDSNSVSFGVLSIKNIDPEVTRILNAVGLSRVQGNLVFAESEVRFIPEPNKPNPVWYNYEPVGAEGVIVEDGVQFKVGKTRGVIFEFHLDLANKKCTVSGIRIISEHVAKKVPKEIELPRTQGMLILGSKDQYFKKLGLSDDDVLETHAIITVTTDEDGQRSVSIAPSERATIGHFGIKTWTTLRGPNNEFSGDVITLHEGEVIRIGKLLFAFSEAECKLKHIEIE